MERRLSSCPLPLLRSDRLSSEHLQLQNNENPFIRVVQNSLVVEHLAEYLFFEDLKALTLVSRDCLSCFRNTKSYLTRARFTITETRHLGPDDKEVDIAASLHVLQRSTYDWRNLTIELGVPGLFSDNRISETEHCLRSAKSVLFYSYRQRDDADDLNDWLLFEPVLQRMEDLRELEIYSTCIMLREQLLSSGDALQQIFSKLESLKINACSSHFPKVLPQRLKFEGNLKPRLYSNLKKLCLNLPMSDVDIEIRADHCSSVVKIVDLKKDTLEELQLHLDVFGVEEMKTMRLPKLKRLLLIIDDLTPLEGVETFLINQAPLEELRIRMVRFPLGPLIKHLEDADKLGKMQKLCIQTLYGLPEDSWTFLKGMRKLEVVHFVHVPCYCEYPFDSCPDSSEKFDGLRQSYPQIRFNEWIESGSSCFDFGCDFYLAVR